MNQKITITIDSNDKCYKKVNDFIVRLLLKHHPNQIVEFQLADISLNGCKRKIDYLLPENQSITFNYEQTKLTCIITKISKDHATYSQIEYLCQLQLSSDSREVIENLIFEACDEKNVLNVYHYSVSG